ncbi:MAG TPA: APC family permease [Gemmatimonadales bacterium]|nr:APC family permease [Gemmatimonadales bacterium]HRX19092.1 APC family permease [Gemmatimonadales bacterium]
MLRFRDLVWFYVVAIFVIRLVPVAAAAGPSVVGWWALALACFFLPLGLTVIDLSAREPGEGGLYLWVRRAFGETHGFLAAWFYWTSTVIYLPSVLMFAAAQVAGLLPGPGSGPVDPPVLGAIALALLGVITLVNLRGVRGAARITAVSVGASLVTVLGLVVLAVVVAMRTGSATAFTLASMRPQVDGLDGLLFLSTLAYMFAGLESGSLLGDEVRDARRTIPRAVLVAGIVITLLYVATSVAMLVIVPGSSLSGLEGFTDVVRTGAASVGGPHLAAAATTLVSVLLAVMAVGTLSVWLGAAARLPFVVGLDRYLPPRFGAIHPRWQTPHVAILAMAVPAAVLVVLSVAGGPVEQVYRLLVALEIVTFLFPFLYIFGALVALRHEPADASHRRVPGGRTGALVVGGVGLLVTAGSLILAMLPGDEVADPRSFYLTVVGSLALNLTIGTVLLRRGRRRRATALAPDLA